MSWLPSLLLLAARLVGRRSSTPPVAPELLDFAAETPSKSEPPPSTATPRKPRWNQVKIWYLNKKYLWGLHVQHYYRTLRKRFVRDPRLAHLRINLANPWRGRVFLPKAVARLPRKNLRWWKRRILVRVMRPWRSVERWSFEWAQIGEQFIEKWIKPTLDKTGVLAKKEVFKFLRKRWSTLLAVAISVALAYWLVSSVSQIEAPDVDTTWFTQYIGWNRITAIVATVIVLLALGWLWSIRPWRSRPSPTPTTRTGFTHPFWGWLGWTTKVSIVVAVAIAVMFVLGVDAIRVVKRIFATSASPVYASTTTGRPARPLPANIILPIIADCESGVIDKETGRCVKGSARQFADDGVTPLRNQEGSTAIGWAQIMASLHEERAKKLGHDIRTEAGNKAYATILFAEEGLTPWEASRSKWEPELRALGYDPDRGIPTGEFTIKVDQAGGELRPKTGRRWDWTPETATTYEVTTSDGKPTVYPALAQAPIELGSALPPWIKVRVVDSDSVAIDFKFTIPR